MAAADTLKELFEPGAMFGAYRVVRRLGKGGMGYVYLVEDTEGGQLAVKIIDPKVAEGDREYIARFAHEGAFAMKIQHRNLVHVYDMGQDPDTGYYYLVMDYVAGGSVQARLDAEGSFPVDEAVRIVSQVARALVEVHGQGAIHRDIKPGNILFDAEGTPKLMDLGVAKFTESGASIQTSADVMIGTPAYMAPEQIIESRSVDERADIYSLGVVFFEMLTGHRPNEGLTFLEIVAQALEGRPIPDVRTFRPEVSASVAQLLNMMCEPKREQRIATARQVVSIFDRILQRNSGVTVRENIPGLPANWKGDVSAWARRRLSRGALIAAGLGGSLVAALVVGLVWWLRSESPAPTVSTEPEVPVLKPIASIVTEPSPKPPAPVVAPAKPVQLEKPAVKPEKPAPTEKPPPEKPAVKPEKPQPVPAEPSPAKVEPAPRKPSLESGTKKMFPLQGGGEIEMVYCAPCTFTMGSPADEEGRSEDETAHAVTLTKGFWIGTHEVTRRQWRAVMGRNPPGTEGDDLPVTSVSWYDCVAFARKAFKQGGRLPTEAEWECACRAGGTDPFAGTLDEMAWYLGTSRSVLHPVGEKKPNAWGIADMHGNAWEWCADIYGDYPAEAVTDPTGASEGTTRVMRGGWAKSLARKCRSSARGASVSNERSPTCGFRLCRSAEDD